MDGPLGEGPARNLVGDAKAEGAARESRAAFSGKEEKDAVAQGFHKTVLLGKLRQAVRRATYRRGEGVSSRMTNAPKTGDHL